MRLLASTSLLAFSLACSTAFGYVEAPHTLGFVCRDSTNVVLVQILKVNKEKGLIIYKKVEDLKGKHPTDEIRHNIGKRGFHAREWQNVMNWAEEGKLALFFHNGGASETCIGTYWYQCYKENDWWGMSHAEPFLLRTFYGDVEKLSAACKLILQNKEVVVTALADGNKEQLHLRKGKLLRNKASLTRLDWNARRDFVAFGGDGEEVVEEFRTIVLLGESTPGWRFMPHADVAKMGERWRAPELDDRNWRLGKAPIGYGEEELKKRNGTTVKEEGVPFVFRRTFEVSSDLLAQKNVAFKLCVASDDSHRVFINNKIADDEPDGTDHEFAYWNREVELPVKLLKAGKNHVAVLVRNHQGSSDIYLDMEISAQVALPRVVKVPLPRTGPSTPAATTTTKTDPTAPAVGDLKKPAKLDVDRNRRTVSIPCRIAPRKLPNLNEIYPIEVIACFPAPRGQKAHETVVSFTDIRPSDVHKALEELGLKPGKPARGEGAFAIGPEVRILLEYPGADGRPVQVPVEKTLVNKRDGTPLPTIKWYFTGSAQKQPDPEKDDKVFGADMTGTLIAIFPVTDDTVFQTNLTMKDEPLFKLEVSKALPKEGTPARLIIEAK